MNILLISAGIYEYDGRLRELIKVAQMLGPTYYITKSANSTPIDKQHFIYKEYKEGGIFNYMDFIQFCIKIAESMEGIDVVIADNRKAIIPALWTKRRKNIKYAIQDARELYTIDGVKGFRSKIGCLIEKVLNKKFDLTICANNARAQIMYEYYGLNSYPIVFENIRKLEYDFKFDKNLYDERYKDFFNTEKWRIISTSGCGIERGTLEVVIAVGSLGLQYELYLIGESSPKDIALIKNTVEKYKFKNVFILEPMNQNELKYFMSHCDIGLVNYHQKDLNNKYCASGKIYEFLYEGLPILATTNPPLKAICESNGIGVASEDYSSAIKEITDNYTQYKTQVFNYIKEISPERNNYQLAEQISSIIDLQ